MSIPNWLQKHPESLRRTWQATTNDLLEILSSSMRQKAKELETINAKYPPHALRPEQLIQLAEDGLRLLRNKEAGPLVCSVLHDYFNYWTIAENTVEMKEPEIEDLPAERLLFLGYCALNWENSPVWRVHATMMPFTQRQMRTLMALSCLIHQEAMQEKVRAWQLYCASLHIGTSCIKEILRKSEGLSTLDFAPLILLSKDDPERDNTWALFWEHGVRKTLEQAIGNKEFFKEYARLSGLEEDIFARTEEGGYSQGEQELAVFMTDMANKMKNVYKLLTSTLDSKLEGYVIKGIHNRILNEIQAAKAKKRGSGEHTQPLESVEESLISDEKESHNEFRAIGDVDTPREDFQDQLASLERSNPGEYYALLLHYDGYKDSAIAAILVEKGINGVARKPNTIAQTRRRTMNRLRKNPNH